MAQKRWKFHLVKVMPSAVAPVGVVVDACDCGVVVPLGDVGPVAHAMLVARSAATPSVVKERDEFIRNPPGRGSGLASHGYAGNFSTKTLIVNGF